MRAAVAQLVRALGCGPRGRWFESTQLYQMRRVGPRPRHHPQSSSRAGGNEAGRRLGAGGIAADGAQRGLRLADQVFEPPPRSRGSEHADQRCLMSGRVLTGGFADRRRIALDVEQVVGDLECLAKSGTVMLKRRPLAWIGLAQDGPGKTAKAQERSRLHCLQDLDILFAELGRRSIEPSFGREVEHL